MQTFAGAASDRRGAAQAWDCRCPASVTEAPLRPSQPGDGLASLGQLRVSIHVAGPRKVVTHGHPRLTRLARLPRLTQASTVGPAPPYCPRSPPPPPPRHLHRRSLRGGHSSPQLSARTARYHHRGPQHQDTLRRPAGCRRPEPTESSPRGARCAPTLSTPIWCAGPTLPRSYRLWSLEPNPGPIALTLTPTHAQSQHTHPKPLVGIPNS